jgi:uncharacterized protein (DUF58 family)
VIARDLIKKIRKIEIYTKRLVNDQMAGSYHSVFKGRGMAFEEVRQYQPGDDIRLVDWNVSARMNDIYVKLFVEEREMTVMLVVDMSASGLFGTGEQSKREIAAEMAAVVAFSAIKNNDRVGLIIFTDEVEKFVPPKKGKKHVLRVIGEILSYQPRSRKTNLAVGLEYLGRVTKRRSVVFLLSDFIGELPESGEGRRGAPKGRPLDRVRDAPPPDLEHALRVVARKHDLIPVTITDRLEEELPSLGILHLLDFETGEVVAFDCSLRGRTDVALFRRRAREARETLFRKLKMDFMNVRTDQPYVSALVDFFKAREKRLRRG